MARGETIYAAGVIPRNTRGVLHVAISKLVRQVEAKSRDHGAPIVEMDVSARALTESSEMKIEVRARTVR